MWLLAISILECFQGILKSIDLFYSQYGLWELEYLVTYFQWLNIYMNNIWIKYEWDYMTILIKAIFKFFFLIYSVY